MLAVCFTRCDAIKRNCWMLNDTSVFSALPVYYTLLDVIPLRYHCPIHVCSITHYPICTHMFGSAQKQKDKYMLVVFECAS